MNIRHVDVLNTNWSETERPLEITLGLDMAKLEVDEDDERIPHRLA